MISTDHLCMSCMREIGEQKQCPHCGFAVDTPQNIACLPIRHVIANRYLFGKALEQNGEGITYIGWDLDRKVPVSIHEFFPDSIAQRSTISTFLNVMPGCERTWEECHQSFQELWQKLARLRGLSSLISVTDILSDNNTTYAVFEYIRGCTLREYLLTKSRTGTLRWERTRQLLMPVLSAIGTLHSAGIIHRGISPTTLLVGQDGKVWLSGFSIWQARTARGDLNAQLFPGYAAIEQYGFEGQQGSWTDIYAFAGVLYRTLTGTDPIDASLRASNDRLMVPGQVAEQIPAYVIHAMVNAMQIRPEDRTRTVDLLRAELSASPSASIAGEVFRQSDSKQPTGEIPNPAPVQRDEKHDEKMREALKKKKQRSIILRTTGICLCFGLVLFAVLASTVFREALFGTANSNQSTTTTTGKGDLLEVPNLTDNRSYISVLENPVWCERFDFKPQEEYSNTVEAGYIIRQSIPAGTKVPKGTQIVLTISLGKELIELPNITGKKYADVKKDFEKLGFEITLRTLENDGTQQEGVVSDVSLQQGNKYEKGTPIIIRVWGPAPTTGQSGEETVTETAAEELPTNE